MKFFKKSLKYITVGSLKDVITAETLIEAIVKARGNKRFAADILGVHRTTLYNYLKLYPEAQAEADKQISQKVSEMIEQAEDVIDSSLYSNDPKIRLQAAAIVVRQSTSFNGIERRGIQPPANKDEIEDKKKAYMGDLKKDPETGAYIIEPEEGHEPDAEPTGEGKEVQH